MVFNSVTFLYFILAFFPIYFLLRGNSRLVFTFLSSYLFYGWWDWRFLGLIMFSTCVDFFLGNALENQKDEKKRHWYIVFSMILNITLLSFFKYFNFFADSFYQLFSAVGFEVSPLTLKVILPVGISFYTFQSMSYTIDIYRRDIHAEKNFLRFATFISFFPQLVAGPIVRARDFLPQFKNDHNLNSERVILGFGQIVVGFFKKVMIADSLAPVVEQIFSSPANFTSLNLIIGVIFYSFQIYCDFSGYSDIAIGLARILGFDFPRNFNLPYFSKSFREFWSRWHISLSSWLRDYLYIPLGGNRGGKYNTYRNLMLTMLIGGLWHGANWTFIFWGFLHGGYQIIERVTGPLFAKVTKALHLPKFVADGILIFTVYLLTCTAWIFFRATTFTDAWTIINNILLFDNFSISSLVNITWIGKGLFLILLLLIGEIISTKVNFADIMIKSPVFRIASCAIIILSIALLGAFADSQFIYFQF